MGFSKEFWVFFGLSCLEFLFLIGSAIFFKLVKKESLRVSLLKRAFPEKRIWIERIGDIGVGILVGFLLTYFAEGTITFTRFCVIKIFGNEFYNTARSGSIDVSPNGTSIGEVICTILIFFFVISISEEFFFRSVLFAELKPYLKKWTYIVNGVIFALYHVFPGIVPIQTTATYFLYYFFMGILLCLILERQENDLLVNIIAHGTFNALPYILPLLL